MAKTWDGFKPTKMHKQLAKEYPALPEDILNRAVARACREVPREYGERRYAKAKELIVEEARKQITEQRT